MKIFISIFCALSIHINSQMMEFKTLNIMELENEV